MITSIDTSPLVKDHDDSDNSSPIPHTPPRWASAWQHPCSSTKLYFSELSEIFSGKFLSWLAINNCFISGGLFTLVTSMCLPLFKVLGVSAAQQQLYLSIINTPWAMKPCIGVASDLFPIMGYKKHYAAFFSILIGFAGCSALLWIFPSRDIAMQDSQRSSNALADLITLSFTAVAYQGSVLSVLGEGMYAELMKNSDSGQGSSIVSFRYGCLFLGSTVAQSLVGPLCDAMHFRELFWFAVVSSLMPLLPTLAGWIPEKKQNVEDYGMIKLCGNLLLFDRGTFQKKKAPFIVITLCGLAVPLLTFVSVYASRRVSLGLAAALIVAFCAATYSIFPWSVSRIISMHFTCIALSTISPYACLSSVLQDFHVYCSISIV